MRNSDQFYCARRYVLDDLWRFRENESRFDRATRGRALAASLEAFDVHFLAHLTLEPFVFLSTILLRRAQVGIQLRSHARLRGGPDALDLLEQHGVQVGDKGPNGLYAVAVSLTRSGVGVF